MKSSGLFLLVFFLLSPSQAQQQDSIAKPPKYRISFSSGVAVMNPEEINQDIAATNSAFGTTSRSIKSMPELSAMLSLRPQQDSKVVILRVGYLWTTREYPFSQPETKNDPTPTGTVTGSITETYSAYPLSLGVGLATAESDFQVQVEFIYALGYITEEGKFTTSSGKTTSYTRTLFSPAYGFRLAGHFAVPLTPAIRLHIEGGYRGLTFNEYEDETNAQPSPIVFTMGGILGNIGLTVVL